jgi:hypothetical protein
MAIRPKAFGYAIRAAMAFAREPESEQGELPEWWKAVNDDHKLAGPFAQNQPNPLAAVFHANAFRRWALARLKGGFDPDAFQFWTIRLRPNEEALWLADGSAAPIRLELSDSKTSPETRSSWLALGYVGPVNGLGLGYGLSHEFRRGVGPTSWDDISSIHASTSSGMVPYRLETWTVYLGIELAHRWHWSRRWSANLRGFFLPRVDLVNTAGVPAELAGFAERKVGAVFDLAVAGSLDVTVQLYRELAIHAAGLVEVPRASALFFGDHSDLQRTIYYDPVLFGFRAGLGASYTWNR